MPNTPHCIMGGPPCLVSVADIVDLADGEQADAKLRAVISAPHADNSKWEYRAELCDPRDIDHPYNDHPLARRWRGEEQTIKPQPSTERVER